jgi:hypothetical protein
MSALRIVVAVASAALVAACGSPQQPVPITPPSEVAKAPVSRVPVAPASPATAPTPPMGSAITPAAKLDPSTFPAGAIYVCASGTGGGRTVTAIAFDEKVGKLCRTHPEMGPCQYERNICRGSGGRVYAADGTEITMATEAEYDKKVMRVRFKAN